MERIGLGRTPTHWDRPRWARYAGMCVAVGSLVFCKVQAPSELS